jgi:alkyl sulfatase BDS1-like metallo-beta-lactamase superfamily hydrolase
MPGDNIYNTFPNLYTIRGTTHRNVSGWVDSLDHMRSLEPKYLFPSHTKPIEGEDAIQALTIYRDAIQYIHDQTIRLMNKGYYPDEIVEMIDLPYELASSSLLKEFYGTVRWSVRSIYNGYLGWFDGNPSSLDPLGNSVEAQRIASLAGGKENLFKSLEKAVAIEDMQWALQLSDYLIDLQFKVVETNILRKEALFHIGIRASNPNKRNYFLTSALELNPSFEGFPEVKKSESVVNEIDVDTIFSILSVSFNPENSFKEKYSVCFRFDSGKQRAATIRNSTLEISKNIQSCNLNVSTSEKILKETLAGLKSPVAMVATGAINVEGSKVDFLKFLTSFK